MAVRSGEKEMNPKQKIVHNDQRTQQEGSRYGRWLKYAKPILEGPIYLLPLVALWLTRHDHDLLTWLIGIEAFTVVGFSSWRLAVRKRFVKKDGKELVRITVPLLGRALFFMIPKRSREHLIGDLDEEYRTYVLTVCGGLYAWCWWCGQVMGIVGPYLWKWLRRILGLEILRGWRRR